nr:hypothetical protein [Dubosiella newyorkensis]
MSVEEKFIRYVQYDTQSDASSQTIPSTKKQLVLADALKKECEAMGFDRVVEKQGTVYAFLKEKGTRSKEAIGFVAHMDTASEISGKNVKPKIIRDYDGQTIHLNETYSMDPDRFPSLKKVKHECFLANRCRSSLQQCDGCAYRCAGRQDLRFLLYPERLVGRGTKPTAAQNLFLHQLLLSDCGFFTIQRHENDGRTHRRLCGKERTVRQRGYGRSGYGLPATDRD